MWNDLIFSLKISHVSNLMTKPSAALAGKRSTFRRPQRGNPHRILTNSRCVCGSIEFVHNFFDSIILLLINHIIRCSYGSV